ncbi:HNH endonuclease [Nocardia asteroides]|uniref:HNH endonuclease n=1 Tax=Nocardia asteroides TaxID=1824 RepID=UPI00343E622E
MATASHSFRYNPSDPESNMIVRIALMDAWNERCYWCKTKRQISDVQIDHIIPRDLKKKPQQKDALVERLLGPDAVPGYELDALYNLGPICPTPCNGDKSNHLYDAPILMEVLRRAAAKVPQVASFIQSYKVPTIVQKALAAVVVADLEDDRCIEALTQFAPLLASRLERIDFSTTEEIFDPTADEPELVAITMDRLGRRARDVLEVLSGQGIDGALAEPIRAVKRAIADRLLSDITSQVVEAGHLYPDVSPATTRMSMELNALRYNVDDDQFEMLGTFDADGVAEAAVMGADGDGLQYLQRESDGHGTFEVRFWCTHGAVESDDVVELGWNEGCSPAPRRRRLPDEGPDCFG